MKTTFKITFNGKPYQTEAKTLAGLLTEQGYEPNSRVATAVTGQFVAKHIRDSHLINDGDQVEVVAPMQGG